MGIGRAGKGAFNTLRITEAVMEATVRLIVFGPLLVAWVILFCRVATELSGLHQ